MTTLFEQLQAIRPGIGDVVEILIVTALLYWFLVFIQRTRAFQIFLGLLVLAGVYFLAEFLDLRLIRRILTAVFEYGAIAALVVFQPELRNGLARLGQTRMMRIFNRLHEDVTVDEIITGVEQLSRSKTGAIIACERDVALDDYAETGRPVQARVSAEMLTTIFTPYSPLHDGAVIIRGDTIESAGAILPLTQTPLQDRTLGTRHRAALGLSEETDAVVIVVSEETARISLAYQGRLELGVEPQRIRDALAGETAEGKGLGRFTPLVASRR